MHINALCEAVSLAKSGSRKIFVNNYAIMLA